MVNDLYDMSIHSSTDAKEWTDFFFEKHPNCNVDKETMLGWFANAMIAMYDNKQNERVPLSDDEIFNIGYNAGFTLDHVKNDDSSVYGFLNEYGYIDNNPYFKFVRAIEKEHGIGVEND